jgi:hypothetical protein
MTNAQFDRLVLTGFDSLVFAPGVDSRAVRHALYRDIRKVCASALAQDQTKGQK